MDAFDASHAKDVALLRSCIERLAPASGGANAPRVCRFIDVFNDAEQQQQVESLMGGLKAARKQGVIAFEGQILLQGANDDVPITLLQAGGGGGSATEEIHYSDGSVAGCAMSKAEFLALEASGKVDDTTIVWKEGWAEWTPLVQCRDRLQLSGADTAEVGTPPEPAEASEPAAEAMLVGKMQIQWEGKGNFQPVHMELTSTALTIRKKKGGPEISSASCACATVSLPKNERKGHPYSFRIDLTKPDSQGGEKYICSVSDAAMLSQWMQAVLYGVQENPLASLTGGGGGGERKPSALVCLLPA